MYYMIDNYIKVLEYSRKGVTQIRSINVYLKKLATRYLCDITGYKKAVKKTLNLSRNIPIYLSSDYIFFFIKTSNERYLINYAAILGVYVTENIPYIVFESGVQLALPCSYTFLQSQFKKINQILNYFSELTKIQQ